MTESWKVVEVTPGAFFSLNHKNGSKSLRVTVMFADILSNHQVLQNAKAMAEQRGVSVPESARVRTITVHLEGSES